MPEYPVKSVTRPLSRSTRRYKASTCYRNASIATTGRGGADSGLCPGSDRPLALAPVAEESKILQSEGVQSAEPGRTGSIRNKSNARRKYLEGRGPMDMTAVAGVKDGATNKVVAQVVRQTDAATMHGFVEGLAEETVQVYTDDAKAYAGIDTPHEASKHSVSQYADGMAHTNGMGSFRSMMKRGHKGAYHKMSARHRHRHVNEFAGRHNVRNADFSDQMRGMVASMRGRFLPYQMLKKENGLPNGARNI